MVAVVGTAEMSGVAVANQLLFVFNLCVFGGLSGPSIFGAQYYGAGDLEGLRNAFRIKLWITAGILLCTWAVFAGWGDALIRLLPDRRRRKGHGRRHAGERPGIPLGHAAGASGLRAFPVLRGHAARDRGDHAADECGHRGGY